MSLHYGIFQPRKKMNLLCPFPFHFHSNLISLEMQMWECFGTFMRKWHYRWVYFGAEKTWSPTEFFGNTRFKWTLWRSSLPRHPLPACCPKALEVMCLVIATDLAGGCFCWAFKPSTESSIVLPENRICLPFSLCVRMKVSKWEGSDLKWNCFFYISFLQHFSEL